jgi:hemoglobin
MLTSGRYKGNPMAAHLKQPIEPEFFERWLALWQETTGEVFGPEAAAQFQFKAQRIAESLKLALFYKPADIRILPRRGNPAP